MSADLISSFKRYLTYLHEPNMRSTLMHLEEELCAHHNLPRSAGYSHSKECKAVEQITSEDENARLFLLGRLEAIRRYAHANQFERWPKWARCEVRLCQKYLLNAAKQVDQYETCRKRLERMLKEKLPDEHQKWLSERGLLGSGLPYMIGEAGNIRQFAESAGAPLKSERAYLFGKAQMIIFADILRRFPKANNNALSLLVSWALKKPINPKNLREWRKNNRKFLEGRGRVISLY